MPYARVVNNMIIQERGRLPDSDRRLDTDQWVLGLPTAPVALQQVTGWYEITDIARPADTATKTYDRSVTLVAGVPTVTWTQRDKTASEITAATQQSNRATLLQQAAAALQTNTDALALPDPTNANNTYLAIGAPTNAQVVAEVRALTQQMNAVVAQARAAAQQRNKIIRLLIGQTDGTD